MKPDGSAGEPPAVLPLPRPLWWVRKMISEGPAHLPRQLSYRLRKSLVDRRFPTAAMRRRARTRTDSTTPGREAAGSGPVWHFGETEISRIVERVPEERRLRVIERAAAWLDGRFCFRGLPEVRLNPVDWSFAPTGDRSWTWDLNRHTWFAELGLAYHYAGDPRFALGFAHLADSWVNENAHRLGRLRWDTPFEVAARINSWMWCWWLFRASPEWTRASRGRFLDTLGLLAEYLYQTIEVHNPGNHILLEAKALALCAEAFPEFFGAATWASRAWRILERELALQICSDGVHAQRSTMYHRIIAGELADLWLFGQRNGRSWADGLGEVVRRMAEFERWLDVGGGHHPQFGDGYAEDTYLRFAASAVQDGLAGRVPDARQVGSAELTYWLLADHLAQATCSQPPTLETPARAFPDGGYFVARSGWTHGDDVLVWDCGPVGYGTNRKHAHLDSLSFTLSLRGVPVLIDPGGSRLPARERELRGTRAHNTIVVDGRDQGIVAERKDIWDPPISRLDLWAASPELVVMCGTHDGYARLPDPVRHTRTILCLPDRRWLVMDRLEGRDHHQVEQVFHAAPEATYQATTGQVTFWKGEASLSVSTVSGVGPPTLDIETGVAELECNRPVETHLIVRRYAGPLPVSLAVVLSAGPPPAIACRVMQTSSGSSPGSVDAVEIVDPPLGWRVYIGHSDKVARGVPIGPSDASVVIERLENGRPTMTYACTALPGRPDWGRIVRIAESQMWTEAR